MSEDERLRFYGEDYFADFGYANVADDRARAKWSRLSGLAAGARDRSLLDIGCATGELLACARHDGWDVYGIEPSAWAAAKAAARIGGDRIVEGVLVDAVGRLPRVSLVHAGHVLEHVDDPVAFLRLASQFVKPGGMLCVEVPQEIGSIQGLWSVLRGRIRVEYPAVHHTLFLRAHSLRRLFAVAGLNASVRSYSPPEWVDSASQALRRCKTVVFTMADRLSLGASLEGTAMMPDIEAHRADRLADR